MRESPALKMIELLRNAGAEVSYHDPHVAEFDGLELGAARAGGLRLRRRSSPRTPSIDYADVVAAARSSSTSATRRKGARSTARSGSCDDGRRRRARLLGPEPRRGTSTTSPTLAWLCDASDRAARASSRRATRGATPTRTSTTCSPTRSWTRSSSRPRCRRTTSSRARRSRPASTCSSRSRRRCAAPRWTSWSSSPHERDLVLMPGHLLLYHPGVQKLKELIDSGELGDVLCIYGNRQNLGIVRTNENALWSLGVHDLSVILYLLDEEPYGGDRARPRLPDRGRRGRRLLLPALPVREDRAHAPLVARPAQDAEADRRRPREDGRLRRHGARAQGDGLREGAVEARRDLRRVADAHRRHLHPEDRDRRAAAPRVRALPAAGRRRRRPAARSRATARWSCARSSG